MIPLNRLHKLNPGTVAKYLAERKDQVVHIFSGHHHAFWRPDCKGYTDNWQEAGIYTLHQAYMETRHCGPEKEINYITVRNGVQILRGSLHVSRPERKGV